MSYKRYKSAAHNFARSFASTLNWVADDYAMSYLARAVLRTGTSELQADLLSGNASPPELVSPPVLASIQGRVEWFPRHLEAEGADPARVREAMLTIRFDIEELAETQLQTPIPMWGFIASLHSGLTERLLIGRSGNAASNSYQRSSSGAGSPTTRTPRTSCSCSGPRCADRRTRDRTRRTSPTRASTRSS